jgi:hypothetical protein
MKTKELFKINGRTFLSMNEVNQYCKDNDLKTGKSDSMYYKGSLIHFIECNAN